MLSRAASLANKAASAVAPTPNVSLADVFAELDALRADKAALQDQVALLSSLRPAAAAAAAVAAAATASNASESAAAPVAAVAATAAADTNDAASSGFSALRSDLASHLGVDLDEAKHALDAGLREQLAAARAQSSNERLSSSVNCAVLRAELHAAEEALGAAKLESTLRLDAARDQRDRLEHELETAAQRSARALKQQLAAARAQASQRVADLEERLAFAEDEIARRCDDDDYAAAAAASAEAEREQRASLLARCEQRDAEVAELRSQLASLRASHEPMLLAETSRRRAAEAELSEALESREQARRVASASERQLEQLSNTLSLRVAELDDLRTSVRRAEDSKQRMVDKKLARQWVVNYAENVERGRYAEALQILGMMATYWDFAPEDLVRVGLKESDGMPAEQAVAQGSLLDAFESFLTGPS